MALPLTLSPAGLAELKEYEGCRREAYQDEGGVWTIGYGDTRGVLPGQRISQDECDGRLMLGITEFATKVQKALTRVPTQGQFDAMVSLCYNIGAAAFAGSTLVRKFNVGDPYGAAKEFGKWIHVKKIISANLVRRRFSEVVRFHR